MPNDIGETKNLNPISVAEFRKRIGTSKKVTLPESQAVFEVKRLTPMDYIREGLADIPNDFFKFIGDISTNQAPDSDDEQTKKNYELFENFLRVTITKGIVNPPTLLRYDKNKPELVDTHLIFAELSTNDQAFLINIIVGKING